MLIIVYLHLTIRLTCTCIILRLSSQICTYCRIRRHAHRMLFRTVLHSFPASVWQRAVDFCRFSMSFVTPIEAGNQIKVTAWSSGDHNKDHNKDNSIACNLQLYRLQTAARHISHTRLVRLSQGILPQLSSNRTRSKPMKSRILHAVTIILYDYSLSAIKARFLSRNCQEFRSGRRLPLNEQQSSL